MRAWDSPVTAFPVTGSTYIQSCAYRWGTRETFPAVIWARKWWVRGPVVSIASQPGPCTGEPTTTGARFLRTATSPPVSVTGCRGVRLSVSRWTSRSGTEPGLTVNQSEIRGTTTFPVPLMSSAAVGGGSETGW